MQLFDRVQQQWVTLTVRDKFPVDENGNPCYAKPAGAHDTAAEANMVHIVMLSEEDHLQVERSQ